MVRADGPGAVRGQAIGDGGGQCPPLRVDGGKRRGVGDAGPYGDGGKRCSPLRVDGGKRRGVGDAAPYADGGGQCPPLRVDGGKRRGVGDAAPYADGGERCSPLRVDGGKRRGVGDAAPYADGGERCSPLRGGLSGCCGNAAAFFCAVSLRFRTVAWNQKRRGTRENPDRGNPAGDTAGGRETAERLPRPQAASQ